ncbi:MAG: DUF4743 domain-containing protein [Burkholderiales bacterium]
MDEARILPAVVARLTRLFAPPSIRLIPITVDGTTVGAVTPERARRLAAFDQVFAAGEPDLRFVDALRTPLARTAALDRIARVLAAEGALTGWRNERYAVAGADGAPVMFDLERAAARYFGVSSAAVHVNGLVSTASGPAMWIARRSPTKAIDPGMLDNLVGGGIAAGSAIAETLAKEAWEEAGIARPLAATARPAGGLAIDRLQPDGVQRETIHVFDLWLPDGFVPANQDGEVVAHRLVPLDQVAALLAQSDTADEMTGDSSLVALDCLLRLGAIGAGDPSRPALERLCRRPG